MKPLVYLAGPYTADPVANTRRAIFAARDLWATGKVAVVVPHLSLVADLVAPMTRDDWYRFDLDIVARCDAVYRLDGESPGADAEVAFAEERGIPVFRAKWELVAWAGEWEAANGHVHCDRDPVECSYQALVGEHEERGRQIATIDALIKAAL